MSSKRPVAAGSAVMSEGGRRRIVSSAHLVSDKAAELSEVEYGLIVASNAFGLWTVRGTAAALAEFPDIADLGVIDILCLHSVNHRGRAKKLADICFKLNVEDTHIVNYALKKLIRAGPDRGPETGQGSSLFDHRARLRADRTLHRNPRGLPCRCVLGAWRGGCRKPGRSGQAAACAVGALWAGGPQRHQHVTGADQ